MTELLNLADRDLQEIANALRAGRLLPPFPIVAFQRVLPTMAPSGAADALCRLSDAGFTPDQIATTLDLLRADRLRRPRVEDAVQLVTTGPEVDGNDNRDTSVVVQDLFASANRSVLIAGYVVYQGQRVFQALADRMREIPGLQVKLFLDIQRPYGDATLSADLTRRFSQRFAHTQWPVDRPLPSVYFDARSLDMDPAARATLHAKCIVVDDRDVFVSSANFTEAAQRRNVELGLLLRSSVIAGAIRAFFEFRLRNRLFQQLI